MSKSNTQWLTYPEEIDETAGRIVAAFVAATAAAAVVTQAYWLLAVLVPGFVVRAAVGPRYSLLSQLAQRVVAPALRLGPNPVWSTPKRFAQLVGCAFTASGALLALALGATLPAAVLGGVLAVCAALEAGVGFCLGCKMFDVVGPAWERLRVRRGAR